MRSTKIFGLAAVLLLSTVMIGGLWSQQLPGSSTIRGVAADGIGSAGFGAWASPQSQATSGRYRSAADDFIRPDSYTSAKVENWFAFASFGSTTVTHLGYAKKLEKAYIAAYYGGTFWSNLYNDNYTEEKVAGFGGGGDKKVRAYTTLPTFGTTAPDNRFALLLGVADMGFRLSFRTNHDTIRITDSFQVNSTTDYKSYERELGLISPQLAWSMAKNLTANGIKPYAAVDLDFYRNYTKQESYTTDWEEKVTNSQNYFQPILSLGMGGYTFFRKDGFSATADVDNILWLRAYDDNEYSYGSGSSAKTKSIKGTYNGTSLTEINSWIYDRFTPSLAGSWSSGPLALKFKLNLNLTFGGEETTSKTAASSPQKNGDDSKVSYIGFNPDMRLAAQWKCIPNKLTLNAGGRINLADISRLTTESTTYAAGVKGDSTTTIADTKGTTANQLFLGVTFTPLNNLFFEANCGGSASAMGSNNINVFGTGTDGLFNFASILVGLKF